MNSESEEDLPNYFERLPDCLLLVIFAKVADIKSLCICSTSCRRFASLVSQTDSLSLKMPRQNDSSSSISVVDLRPRVCRMLKNFIKIHSLFVELPRYFHGTTWVGVSDDSLLKWNFKVCQGWQCLSVLTADSFCRMSENDDGNEKEGEHVESEPQDLSVEFDLQDLALLENIIDCIDYCMKCIDQMEGLLTEILREHKMIRKVVITDENREGKMCINFSNSSAPESSTRSTEAWYVPKLKLPMSGYVMEGGILTLVRHIHCPIVVDSDEAALIAGAFEEEGDEGKAYGEAIREIMVNRKKGMKHFFRCKKC